MQTFRTKKKGNFNRSQHFREKSRTKIQIDYKTQNKPNGSKTIQNTSNKILYERKTESKKPLVLKEVCIA